MAKKLPSWIYEQSVPLTSVKKKRPTKHYRCFGCCELMSSYTSDGPSIAKLQPKGPALLWDGDNCGQCDAAMNIASSVYETPAVTSKKYLEHECGKKVTSRRKTRRRTVR